MNHYKHDPDAFLEGTVELTLKECGAYIRVIDLLYSRDGDVPDDDRFVARGIHCDVREWRAVKKRLMQKGKIRAGTDGRLHANRVDETISEAISRSDVMRHVVRSRRDRSQKANEFNGRSILSRAKKKDTSLSSEPNPAREVAAAPPSESGGRESKEGEIPISDALRAKVKQWKRQGVLKPERAAPTHPYQAGGREEIPISSELEAKVQQWEKSGWLKR